MFVFTSVVASFVITETASADNNIVYKRLTITYYYCSSVEYVSGTPIYSTCSTSEDGMEDAEHPPDTEEEVWGWRPIYEWRGWGPWRDRVIVGFDREYLGIEYVHTDHPTTIY